jgi:hypothetical protein
MRFFGGLGPPPFGENRTNASGIIGIKGCLPAKKGKEISIEETTS